MEETITLGIAFIAGVVSFFSPCILPLIPAYFSYMTGINLSKKTKINWDIFINTVLFVAGFGVVFSLLGVLFGIIGSSVSGYRHLIDRIGGAIIILFGLYTVGLLNLPNREFKLFHIRNAKRYGKYLLSFLVGGTFAAGWSPCVGAILGSILLVASTNGSVAQGGLLLFSFSVGLAVPFLITGFIASIASGYVTKKMFEKLRVLIVPIKIISGILLIILGIAVFTDNFGQLMNLFL